MTDHKFTDDEVIKALECCHTIDGDDCSTCPYRNKIYELGLGGCVNDLVTDALALINRQKAQIDSLLRIKALAEEIVKQTSETQEITIREFAERLKSDLGRIPQHKFTRSQVEWSINTITDRILGGI